METETEKRRLRGGVVVSTNDVVILLKNLLIEFNKNVYLGDEGKLYYEQSEVYSVIMNKIKEVENDMSEMPK